MADTPVVLRFDQGTLVLEEDLERPHKASIEPSIAAPAPHGPANLEPNPRDPESQASDGSAGPSEATELAELVWDPRTGTYRLPAYRYRDLMLLWRGRHLTPADATRRLPAAEVTLRPYQAIALASWVAGGYRGVVTLPTGAGKTYVGLAAVAEARVPALILTPTRILLHQWVEQAQGVLPYPIGILGDGQRRVRPVTVATFASAVRWMPRLGHRFPLLIVDETHHFGGSQTEVLEMSIAPFRLGLTATPPVEQAALETLERVLGPVVSEVSLGELTGTYLAPFDHHVLKLPLSRRERGIYDPCLRSFLQARALAGRLARDEGTPGSNWTALMRHLRRVPGGPEALERFRRAERLVSYTEAKARALGRLLERHEEQRVLVFAADNAAVYRIARDHLLWPITCDVGRSERKTALEHFAAGRLRGLCSAQVLNEGYDVPEAEVAIVVGARQGLREQVQRVGRVLRPRPGKRATLYELVAAGTFEERRAARRSLRTLTSPKPTPRRAAAG